MRQFILALFLSILIHIFFLYDFKIKNQDIKNKPFIKNSTQQQYTYIRLAKIQQPSVKKRSNNKRKKQKLQPKSKPKPKLKQKPAIVKKAIPQPKKHKLITDLNSLDYSFNYQDYSVEQKIDNLNLDPLTKSYIKLYGQEYFKFTKEQREFLNNNLNIIGRITQQYLIYPSFAIRTRQSGTNIVTFILKKNGDITTPKIITTSGYKTLDDNSIKTIKIAYKDYPTPKDDIKIIIYVNYILY
jgi:protein TonB